MKDNSRANKQICDSNTSTTEFISICLEKHTPDNVTNSLENHKHANYTIVFGWRNMEMHIYVTCSCKHYNLKIPSVFGPYTFFCAGSLI